MPWDPTRHFVHDAAFREAANRAGLDWLLVKAVAAAESGLDPQATIEGRYGLMLLPLSVARDLGYTGEPDGLLDVPTNLELGVKRLSRLIRVLGDYRMALVAYRFGLESVQQLQRRYGAAWRRVEPNLPAEARQYVETVLRHRDDFVAYEAQRKGR